MLKAGDDALCA